MNQLYEDVCKDICLDFDNWNWLECMNSKTMKPLT